MARIPRAIRSIPPITSTGTSGAIRGGRKNKKVESIRAWTFTSNPKFARYPSTDKYVLVERISEPSVRVKEDTSEVVVIANLNGVKEEDIQIDLHGDILEISAQAKDETGIIKYAKEILLPFVADPGSIKSTFENDILEIEMQVKRKERQGKSK